MHAIKINHGNDIAFGPSKSDLLEAINRHGSISAAEKSMNMSYKRASTRDAKMTIYQVVDEENNLVCEYQYRDTAIHSAEDMTVWFADHYYHVEEAMTQEYFELA